MLHWAEALDRYRVFPRSFLVACFIWAVWVSMVLLHWYTALSKEDRGLEATGFGSVVFVAVLGFLKMVYQTYSDAGQTWNAPISTSSTTTTSSTVVAPTTIVAPPA
jgi:hypothetical protein